MERTQQPSLKYTSARKQPRKKSREKKRNQFYQSPTTETETAAAVFDGPKMMSLATLLLVFSSLLPSTLSIVEATTTATGNDPPELIEARLIPYRTNALNFDFAVEKDGVINDCAAVPPNDYGVDAQTTKDDDKCLELGPCHVAFAQPNEYVVYNFVTSEDMVLKEGDGGLSVYVDITIRVASNNRNKLVRMEIFDDIGRFIDDSDYGEMGPGKDFYTPGLGYQNFEDITWKMVELISSSGQFYSKHRLLVAFSDGQVNLCSVKVEPSKYSPSIPPNYSLTFPAIDYSNAYDKSERKYGNCDTSQNYDFDVGGFSTIADAQYTKDRICLDRDHSTCNIGWTQPEEYVEYHFYNTDYDDYDIWIRVSAVHADRKIRVELNPVGDYPQSRTFDVRPTNSWQTFHDIVWDLLWLTPTEYYVRVYFETGFVNLCSVSIKPSTSRYNLFIPATYNALMYTDFIDKTPKQNYGNCPPTRYGGTANFGGMDAQYTDDPICCDETTVLRDTEACCNIGWTQPDEVVYYTFDVDTTISTSISLSFRVASQSSNKRLQVTVSRYYNDDPSPTKVFKTPGRGWGTYETLRWSNIDISQAYKQITVEVVFLDGNVNLCSIGAKYDT